MAVRLKQEHTDIPIPDITRDSFQEQDVLELELLDFIENVQARKKPVVSGQEGRRALEIALSVMQQIKENQSRFFHLLNSEGNFGFIDNC